MKENKFRAWDDIKCEYIYDPVYMDGIWYLDEDLRQVVEVEQYIGQKDKNDKEVYEGDILEAGLSKIEFVVTFENGSWIGRDIKKRFKLSYPSFKFAKIIGNIHENKVIKGV